MTFDFDTVFPRLATDSQKWQKYESRGTDVLPLWVADMDFRSAPPILEALHERVNHGIFGYARPTRTTTEVIVSAMRIRYGWAIDPSWIVWLPGLVCGLNVTAKAFAEPGDAVMCCTPVYPPFASAPKNSGRESLAVPLALNTSERRWEMDFETMEKAVTSRTKLFFLCNPHNPVARVFRKDELERLAEFCLKHKLVLCADEIHCDLILDVLPHCTMATLGAEIAARTITLMAPSKAYNLPGLGTSFAIISDPKLRLAFVRATAGIVAEVTSLGYTACEAAYRHGEPWRQALLTYLRANRDYLFESVAKDLPGIKIDAPIEATYLAWLNVEELGLADPIAHFEQHGVGLSDGVYFGAPKGQYVRLNFGCPRATLVEAIQRMKAGVAAARQ